MPRAVRTRSLPACQDPSAPTTKPKTSQCLPCDSKWSFKCSYLTSLQATASSSASSPFSKGQQTSIISTCSGVSMTMSGQTGEPLSGTVLSVDIEPTRTAAVNRSTILLCLVVMAGMLEEQ